MRDYTILEFNNSENLKVGDWATLQNGKLIKGNKIDKYFIGMIIDIGKKTKIIQYHYWKNK